MARGRKHHHKHCRSICWDPKPFYKKYKVVCKVVVKYDPKIVKKKCWPLKKHKHL